MVSVFSNSRGVLDLEQRTNRTAAQYALLEKCRNVKELVRRHNVHRPNGPTHRVLGGDSKIFAVVKPDVGSATLCRNEDLQSVFVQAAHFYSET
jgi:hypothetical protein